MTSKLVVNTIEADTGISSVSFASSISLSSTSKFHFSAAGIDIGADTNINRPAAGVLGFNINSAEKVRINSTGQAIFKGDSGITEAIRIAPAIDASTQQEFGIGIAVNANHTHPAAKITFKEFDASDSRGHLLFYTRGANSDSAPTERLRIKSDGGLSLTSENTTGWLLKAGQDASSYSAVDGHFATTNRTLYLNQETTHRSFVVWNKNGSDGYGFGLDSSGNFKVVYSTTERFRIDSSGKVGIGTYTEGNANADDLTVATTGETGITIRSGASSGGNIYFSDATSGAGEYAGMIEYKHNTNVMLFGTASAPRVYINSTGNVGLGVADPNVLNEPAKFQELTLGGKTEGAGIHLKDDNGNVQGGLFTSDNTGAMIIRTITNHPLIFRTNNTARLTIDSSGNLNVTGITTVGSDLNVSSSLPKIILTDTDGGDVFQIRNDGGSFIVRNATDSQSALTIDGGGNVTTVKNVRVNISTACDGIIGEAYSGYFGLKHADQTIGSEYIILSNDTHTYISCSSGSNIRIRPSANDSTHETIFAESNTTFNSNIVMNSHPLRRNQHHWGHLEGSYNNVGANSTKTNPIYTIGSNYNPAESALSNMYGIGYSHGTNASFISMTNATSWGLYVASDGDCRAFIDSSNGKISITSTITQNASDVRLKTNIKVIDDPIEKIKKIRGVTFDWVDNITSEYDFHPDSMHETGVIAQEIQEVIPDAVTTAPFNGNYTMKSGTDNNFLTVKDEKIIPLCIEAIKELSAQVELLKSKVATLEGS